MSWWNAPVKPLNSSALQSATERQQMLTKPPGSLGQLEGLAIQLAAMQSNPQPSVDNIHISVFAGDHGVAAKGVSAFPQAVTTEMVKNFAAGGAAISVLAKQLSANFEVVNLGTLFEVDAHDQIVDARIATGTADFTEQPAMTVEQLEQALNEGQAAAVRAKAEGAQLFIGGEMGIGNTTSASALGAVHLNIPAIEMVGPGTGLAADQLPAKAQVVEKARELHKVESPYETLRCFGGFEIAGLVGAYIGCAQQGITVLVDGFISTAAALMACALNEGVRDWLLFSHQSAEPAHQTLLRALDAQPLLSLGMRLGEGSGAAVAASLLRSACALHNGMATFEQAGVSEA